MKYLDRRSLLKLGTAVPFALGFSRAGFTAPVITQPSDWRTFDVTTRVDIAAPKDRNRAWIPVPAVNEAQWFKSGASKWNTNGVAALRRDPDNGAEFVHVEWNAPDAAPFIEVTSTVVMRDRTVDLTKSGGAAPLTDAERKYYTKGSDLVPVDGVVKQLADKITGNARNDLDKARAIYDWVVENTARNGKTRGCGTGDVVEMLRSGNLTGKCADLNALYVGLARASGLAARDVYGVRVATSKFGYKSLGTGPGTITGAQHCRAETYITGLGWVPTDPADVRKVVLEEPPGNLALDSEKVTAARETLFGAWEGNWLAYNFARDIPLPGAQAGKLAFMMYPQAECGAERLDCLDPSAFKYSITSKETTV